MKFASFESDEVMILYRLLHEKLRKQIGTDEEYDLMRKLQKLIDELDEP